MNTTLDVTLDRLKALLLGGVLATAFVGVPTAEAVPVAQVQYSPFSANVEGNMPYSQSVVFTFNLRPGEVLNAPANITFRAVATSVPVGTVAAAESYVSFSPSSVTYSPGNSSRQVTVTISFPMLSVPPDGVQRLFTYQIYTVGWGIEVADAGASINAKVTAPQPPSGAPPVVMISEPSQAIYGPYSVGSVPATLPLAFQVFTSAPSTIRSVDATINGSPISLVAGTNVTGLGTVTATAMALMPISGAGTYTVLARGTTDSGQTSEATKSFTVVVSGPPPTVVISQPVNDSDYTYFVGAPPVVVTNSFTATSPVGTSLQTWSAALTYPNGSVSGSLSITPNPPSGTSSTGSTPLSLTDSGKYTLAVTAANQYGNATAAVSFWINRVNNPVDQAVDAFQNASYSVTATGRTDFTYRWYRQSVTNPELGFVALSDNGAYTGTATSTLTVIGATVPMSGDRFRCLLSRTGGEIQSAAALLTVRKLVPVLTWPTPAAITYGTALSGTQLNASANVSGNFVYSPASGAILNAGNQALSVVFTPTSDPVNYDTASKQVTQVVNKAPLTVTANPLSKVYGAGDPMLTYTLGGTLFFSDTVTGALSRVAGENVGNYAINQGTVSAGPNYGISFVGANLTIMPKPITVTANIQTKVYGASDPVFTYLVNVPLVGSDAFTGALARGTGEAVGSYAINLGSLTAGGNYTLTYVGASLTIMPKPITVTANAQAKAYGASDPAFTYSVNVPLVGSDTFSGALARGAGEAVGSYAINLGSLTAGGNYSLTYVGASLTITPKPITVTANAQTKAYGATDPAFTYSVNPPLVVGDAFSGALARAAGEDVGSYAINLGSLTAGGNYSLTYVGANLTITPIPDAEVTISGVVFLDVANLGVHDLNEFGLGGITVILYKGSSVFRSVTTNANGDFSFLNVPADTYEVDAVEPAELTLTDSVARIVSPSLGWAVRDIGLALRPLDLTAIGKMRADGFTIGFWKNNIEKALAGKTDGTQVSAAVLQAYTDRIAAFGLTVYRGITMEQALAIMSSTSSNPADLLSKQLVAAQYNYQDGAYLNGSQALTMQFVLWGEYVLQYSSSFSNSYVIWVQQWFDAYNNSHGGVVGGPGPSP